MPIVKPVTNLPQVRAEIKKFLGAIPHEAISLLEAMAKRVQGRMNIEGEQITYPVQWDSARQKRAFFATNGFSKGIPYERTFGSSVAWTVVKPFAEQVNLFAPHPAGAVSGSPSRNWWQSRIHRGRWPWLKKELFDELDKLPREVIRMLKVLIGRSK